MYTTGCSLYGGYIIAQQILCVNSTLLPLQVRLIIKLRFKEKMVKGQQTHLFCCVLFPIARLNIC
jgi:hypothetical protein